MPAVPVVACWRSSNAEYDRVAAITGQRTMHFANIPRTSPFVSVRRHVDKALNCRKTPL
jgi:hypothetical protein